MQLIPGKKIPYAAYAPEKKAVYDSIYLAAENDHPNQGNEYSARVDNDEKCRNDKK